MNNEAPWHTEAAQHTRLLAGGTVVRPAGHGASVDSTASPADQRNGRGLQRRYQRSRGNHAVPLPLRSTNHAGALPEALQRPSSTRLARTPDATSSPEDWTGRAARTVWREEKELNGANAPMPVPRGGAAAEDSRRARFPLAPASRFTVEPSATLLQAVSREACRRTPASAKMRGSASRSDGSKNVASILHVRLRNRFVTGSAPSRRKSCCLLFDAPNRRVARHCADPAGTGKTLGEIRCSGALPHASLAGCHEAPCAHRLSDGDGMRPSRFDVKRKQVSILVTMGRHWRAARGTPRGRTKAGARRILARRELTAPLLFLTDPCPLHGSSPTSIGTLKGMR